MKNHIAEDLPARKFAPAAAGAAPPADRNDKKENSGKTPEERAQQAVYDIRYKARREDIPLRQAYSEYMQNSSMAGQERNMVKAKLFGKEGGGMRAEDFNPIFKNAASDNVAKALFKVFVEEEKQEHESISLTYLEEFDNPEHRKYKVRVTDKNTKRSYVRMATRKKINQLRANPNIESVEMTEYGEPYEGERKKGSQTARVAAGRGLDPVGKEDSDVNNDGKVNKTDNYLMKRRGAIGNAIATRKEEFIHEAGRKKKSDKPEQLDIRKGICNAVTISPTQGGNEKVGIVAHNELEGELIAETGYSKFLKKVHSLQEKAVSQNQQQLAAMAIEYLDGNMPDASDAIKQMAKMGRKELKKFASTKHEGLPEKVKEEMDCGSDDKKKKNGVDNRSLPTKINIAKNIVRAATGIKNPMVMVASEQTGPALPGENRPGSPKAPGNRPHLPGEKQTPLPNRPKLQRASYEPEGEQIDESRREKKGTPRKPRDPAFEFVAKSMGSNRLGVQPRGVKKDPGQKPPVAGEYGAPESPAQKLEKRRTSPTDRTPRAGESD